MNTSTKTLAGVAICAVLVVSLFVLSNPNPYFPMYIEVPFEVVDPGDGYNYAVRANFTITSSSYWEDLWMTLYSGHYPIPDVPDINFTSDMLIAVFQGERGSSGYITNITRVRKSPTEYLVFVDEIHPGEDCVTLAVMTYPYQIVMISYQVSLNVRFVYNITTRDCG